MPWLRRWAPRLGPARPRRSSTARSSRRSGPSRRRPGRIARRELPAADDDECQERCDAHDAARLPPHWRAVADYRLHGRWAEESRLIRQPREESLGDGRAWRRDLGGAGRRAVGRGTRCPICRGGEGDADVRAVSRRHVAHDPGGRVTTCEVVNGLSGTDRLPVALPLCCGSSGGGACGPWGLTAWERGRGEWARGR
jgi:hypothetical protein